MALHVALLRAVNVAAQNTVGMRALQGLFADLGFEGARTLLQTGNVVFNSRRRAGSALESLLEREAKERLDLTTDVFVRSADQWGALMAANPFAEEAARDPGHLVVMLLKDAVDQAKVTALQDAITGRERFVANDRQTYITYPDGIGRSRLTSVWIEGRLGTRGTARNWNTVLKIAAALGT